MISQEVTSILALVPGLEIAEDDFGEREDIMNVALPNCRCPLCARRHAAEE